jgi:hypothetical protein
MDLDILKFMVPLAFLAIWALTALFTREAKPLPGRIQAPPNPYAPRPAPAPGMTRTTTVERPQPTLRWSPPGNTAPVPRAGGNDDDIVILESTRQVRPGSNQGRGVAPARRSRSKPAPAAKPAPVAPPKFASGGVSQSVNQQLSSSMPITPLSIQNSPTIVQSVASSVQRDEGSDIALHRLVAIKAMMTDPARLREAILINEMLQPPVALRKRGRRI